MEVQTSTLKGKRRTVKAVLKQPEIMTLDTN